MATDDFLYRQNELVVILVALALFLIATELGFRRGRAIGPELLPESRTQVSTLQTAVIGLLALLVAFSFAMAESRFETRQRLVVDESNAIGTAYLRSRMLPEPYQTKVVKLLQDYVDARLTSMRSAIDPADLRDAMSRTERVQQELWSEATAAAGKDVRSVPMGLFIGSLNDLIDLQARRDAAISNHVPAIVLYLLFFAAIVSMGLVGLGCGVGNRRHLPITVAVAMLFASVILVVVDLDRPRRGFIEVSQESMVTLRDSLRGAER